MSLPHWFDRFRMPITVKEFTTDFDADVTPQPLDPNGHVVLEQFPPAGREAANWSAPSSAGPENRNWKELYWEIDGGDGVTVRAAQVCPTLHTTIGNFLSCSSVAASHLLLGICHSGGRLSSSAMGN